MRMKNKIIEQINIAHSGSGTSVPQGRAKALLPNLLLPLWVLFALFSALLYGDGVEAVLSQQEVVEGNTAQLRIVAEGEGVVFPNITDINGVPVLGRGQTQNTSIQVINGKSQVTHTTSLVLTFEPKKSMEIPSFTVTINGKAYQTKPLKLRVVKSTAPKGVSSGAYSLSMKANKKEVIVGEPLVVSVYFAVRNDVRLADNPQYQRPEFKGFLVKEIAQPKRYTKGDHQITELRYILVPEKAGSYHLDPATAKVGLADMSRRDIFGRYFGVVWKPIASNSLDITVKEAPQDAELIGRFYVESKLDKNVTKANKPVNLTVTIQGDGSLEDYEMPNYEIDGVTVYSDDAKITTQVIGDKIQSTYVKKFVFIADSDFTIPARTIKAYDPQSKTYKSLTVPSYRVQVIAPKHQVVTTPASTPSIPQSSGTVHSNITPPATEPKATTGTATMPQTLQAWWMLVVSFLAGMVTMYLVRLLKWRKRPSLFKESDALKILYPHMDEDAEVEAMVRKLYAKKRGEKGIEIDKKALKAMVERYR